MEDVVPSAMPPQPPPATQQPRKRRRLHFKDTASAFEASEGQHAVQLHQALIATQRTLGVVASSSSSSLPPRPLPPASSSSCLPNEHTWRSTHEYCRVCTTCNARGSQHTIAHTRDGDQSVCGKCGFVVEESTSFRMDLDGLADSRIARAAQAEDQEHEVIERMQRARTMPKDDRAACIFHASKRIEQEIDRGVAADEKQQLTQKLQLNLAQNHRLQVATRTKSDRFLRLERMVIERIDELMMTEEGGEDDKDSGESPTKKRKIEEDGLNDLRQAAIEMARDCIASGTVASIEVIASFSIDSVAGTSLCTASADRKKALLTAIENVRNTRCDALSSSSSSSSSVASSPPPAAAAAAAAAASSLDYYTSNAARKKQRVTASAAISEARLRVIFNHMRSIALAMGMIIPSEQQLLINHPHTRRFIQAAPSGQRKEEVIAGAVVWCLSPEFESIHRVTWKELRRCVASIYASSNCMTQVRREELQIHVNKPMPSLDAQLQSKPRTFLDLYFRITYPKEHSEWYSYIKRGALPPEELVNLRTRAHQFMLTRYPPEGIPTPRQWQQNIRSLMAKNGPRSEFGFPYALTKHLLTSGQLGDTQTIFPTKLESMEIDALRQGRIPFEKEINTNLKDTAFTIKHSMTPEIRGTIGIIPTREIELIQGEANHRNEVTTTTRRYLDAALAVAKLDAVAQEAVRNRVQQQLRLIEPHLSSGGMLSKHETECIAVTTIVAAMLHHPNLIMVKQFFSPTHLIKPEISHGLVTAPPVSSCMKKLQKANAILPAFA